MNVLSAIGNVGKDAEVRMTAGGQKAFVVWSVAMTSGYGDRKKTIWLDCTGFGKRFETVAPYIKKGDRIGVTGELGTREYQGKTYCTLEVREVTLLGDHRNDEPAKREPTPQTSGQSAVPAGHDDFDVDPVPF